MMPNSRLKVPRRGKPGGRHNCMRQRRRRLRAPQPAALRLSPRPPLRPVAVRAVRLLLLPMPGGRGPHATGSVGLLAESPRGHHFMPFWEWFAGQVPTETGVPPRIHRQTFSDPAGSNEQHVKALRACLQLAWTIHTEMAQGPCLFFRSRGRVLSSASGRRV